MIHLVISPAASHSGWEDHFSSSQFHYLHHRFFECNYGNSNVRLDKIFGTFRDKLKEKGTTYNGNSEEKIDPKTVALHDSKATLKGFPDLGFAIYIALKCVYLLKDNLCFLLRDFQKQIILSFFSFCIWTLLWFAIHKQFGIHEWNPHYLACLVSMGPILIAQTMTNLTKNSKRSILYPFHKDGWKTISTHLIFAFLVSIGPIYIMIHTLLSNPGDSFYFWVRN